MRLLLIDNHDSFTYNVVEDLRHLGVAYTVIANDDRAAGASYAAQKSFCERFDAIIISPGPGNPARSADVGLSAVACDTAKPIFGICLGHQLLALRSGAKVQRIEPAHGVVADITHGEAALFAGIPEHFQAVRYHSLACAESPELRVTARSADGVIMAFEHRSKPWWAVQFHPESIDTQFGRTLLSNFLRFAGWQYAQEKEIATTRVPEEVAACLQDKDQWVWLEFQGTTVLAQATRSLRAWQEPGRVDVDGIVYAGGIEAWLRPRALKGESTVDFQLGWVGYIGYEYRNFTLPAQTTTQDILPTTAPDVELLDVERALVWQDERCIALSWDGDTRWAAELLQRAKPAPTVPSPLRLTCRDTKAQYLAKIAAVGAQLARGNTYEACLTTALVGEGAVNLATYLELRSHNHSPYAGYWRSGITQILSASPESFLKVRGCIVSSSPIKGTRPRHMDPQELATHPKDLAENRMIVDLVRNDLARIAHPTKVWVTERAAVYTFATVHQLISTITAETATEIPEILQATFPGGSMTGAPKERTMELLEQIEECPRGIYSGAFGWIAATGDAELSMVIRTLVARGTQLHYGVGGAILHASDPEAEYAEIQTKAQAITTCAELHFP
ncbi:MAG: chorismate-binding protein [Corynebacterium sp.]|nr:chorismate-binding protein [Corynebacterium sp.]